MQTSYSTGVSKGITQPIMFSHKHHVQGLGLDCRFCHAGTETSASAGFPDTYTCMGCHSQIWTQTKILEPVRKSLAENRPLQWNRVHNLPDYVYFNHSIHIHKGLQCTTCHGEVGSMPSVVQVHPFRMKDCTGCHSDPEAHGVDPLTIKKYKIKPISAENCYTCHR